MSINNNPLAIFTRGGDAATYRLSLAVMNSVRVLLVGAAVFALAAVIAMHILVDQADREIFTKYHVGGLLSALQMGGTELELDLSGRKIPIRAELAQGALEKHYPRAAGKVWPILILPFGISIIAGAAFGYVSYRQGQREGKDEFIRGQRLASIDEVRARVQKEDPSTIVFGTVPVPTRLLFRNFLAVGSMGTGKSQMLIRTMKSLREARVKTVVYDVTGEFAAMFYREGQDYILNPVDARCAPWNMLADINDVTDPALVAGAFVPEQPNSGNAKFWIDASRTLLEDLIVAGKREDLSMDEMYRAISQTSSEQLHNILKHHKGKALAMMVGESQTVQGIRSELIANPALRYLSFFPQNGDFSIRRWIDEPSDSWLFITSKADIHETIKPFVSVFLSIALAQAMDRPRDTLKLAFVLDELESAGKLESLNIALTQARKFGITTLVGFQSVSQMIRVYGKEMATTFMGNLQNKLILRVEESESAQSLADLLGKEEVEEVKLGISLGEDFERDSQSISRERKDRYIIHPSEITTLPDMTGYLKLAGHYPVARVSYDHIKLPWTAEPFMKRKGLQL